MNKEQKRELLAVFIPNLVYFGAFGALIWMFLVLEQVPGNLLVDALISLSFVSIVSFPGLGGLLAGVLYGLLAPIPLSPQLTDLCNRTFGYLLVSLIAIGLCLVGWKQGWSQVGNFFGVALICGGFTSCIHGSALRFGAKWGERLQKERFAQFFVGVSTPWHRENDETRTNQQP